MAHADTIEVLATQYGLKKHLPEIKRIIKCESEWNPNAFHRNDNGSIDFGLWQMNEQWSKWFLDNYNLNIFVPEENLEAGMILYSLNGNKDWSASRECWHRQG